MVRFFFKMLYFSLTLPLLSFFVYLCVDVPFFRGRQNCFVHARVCSYVWHMYTHTQTHLCIHCVAIMMLIKLANTCTEKRRERLWQERGTRSHTQFSDKICFYIFFSRWCYVYLLAKRVNGGVRFVCVCVNTHIIMGCVYSYAQSLCSQTRSLCAMKSPILISLYIVVYFVMTMEDFRYYNACDSNNNI